MRRARPLPGSPPNEVPAPLQARGPLCRRSAVVAVPAAVVNSRRDRVNRDAFGQADEIDAFAVVDDDEPFPYAYTYLTDSSRLVLAEAGPDWWK